MGDDTVTDIRERVWVEKFDHTDDPPRLVETVFIEHTITSTGETVRVETTP